MQANHFFYVILVFQVLMYLVAIVFRDDKHIATTCAVIGTSFLLFYPFIMYAMCRGF